MKAVLKVWWITLAIKILIAIFLPFANDEAYYWVWGHHPQLSYFDHPGMVGWLFSVGTILENIGNAARLPGVVLGHLTILVWCSLVEPYLDDTKKKFLVIFLALSPFLGIGGMIQTPDVPFLFFWSLGLWFFLRALKTSRTSSYIGLGVALGLGFCSKYLIALFVPCAIVWLVASGEWRRVDYRKAALTVLFGLLFCLPVFIWNSQHDWASFRFQLNHGLNSEIRNPVWPIEYLLGQIGILFPIAIFFALRKKPTPQTSWLHVFGWLPLAFFLYTSFRAHVEANWPEMAHPAILCLALINAPDSKWIRAQAAIWFLATALIISQVVHPWLPFKNLKTDEFTKYDLLLPIVREHNDLYLSSYQMAAAVSYKTRRQFYKLEGMNRRDFYDFIPQSRPTGDSFVVAAETGQSLPAWVSEAGYAVVGEQTLSEKFRLIEVSRRAQDAHR